MSTDTTTRAALTGDVGQAGLSAAGASLTSKGRATRERIVGAASALMLEHGVERTTIEDIQVAASVSASQLYHYFGDKHALVLAVIDHQGDQVLTIHRSCLGDLDSLAALRHWRDVVVALTAEADGGGGCPIGSLAADLSDTDPIARARLGRWFDEWEALLRRGLGAMQAAGRLGPQVDVEKLALALLAAVQGGLLLAQVRRDAAPVAAALDAAIDHVAALVAQ